MVNCNPTRTQVDTESKLGPDENPVLDPTLYRSLAGSLQYLTFTPPDISYADFGLQLYASPTGSLIAYSDADWAGCLSTRRSTSGCCAEYRGVANAVAAETAWIQNLLRELHSSLLSVTLV
ncbi:ribonuclease H-like domain-containing protein [Tanacetum coccineum]